MSVLYIYINISISWTALSFLCFTFAVFSFYTMYSFIEERGDDKFPFRIPLLYLFAKLDRCFVSYLLIELYECSFVETIEVFKNNTFAIYLRLRKSSTPN